MSGAQTSASTTLALKGNGVITGIVLDSVNSQPVSFATLTLSNPVTKKTVDGALANDKGVFTISGLNSGTYSLTASFIGYKTKTSKVVKITGNDTLE